MSYILFASSGGGLATPVSVLNGGTGVDAPSNVLTNLLNPQPPIPFAVPDPADLERAVNEVIQVLQNCVVIA